MGFLPRVWEILSFHEWSVAEWVKRRRISHTSGRNPRSSIETSVRTYSFRFKQCLHFGPETRSPRARREGRLCKVCKVGVLIIFVYCCKYGFQSDTIVVSRRRSPYSMWLANSSMTDTVAWSCLSWAVCHSKYTKTEEQIFSYAIS
jgi:hypothetical protein